MNSEELKAELSNLQTQVTLLSGEVEVLRGQASSWQRLGTEDGREPWESRTYSPERKNER